MQGIHFLHLFSISFQDEEKEDDEVSAAVQKAKTITVPENLVPALTDKTFDVIKNENDILVVDFFQPCKFLKSSLKNALS